MADPMGLRELRQNASELVRRAEAGEHVTITVSGRPAAVLGPISTGASAWHTWDEVAPAFASRTDESWADDRHDFDDQIDQTPHDPWERE